MALIAKPLSACVTFPATIEPDLPSYSVTHNFLSNPFQKIHMMETHIGGLFDAVLILLIGFLEKRLFALAALGKGKANDTVSERKQYDQEGNGHHRNSGIVIQYFIEFHIDPSL